MRKSIFILAAIAALPIYASAGARPANAETIYPYCTTESRWDYPHCDYRSFEQCVAVNAGMNTMCVPNKRFTGTVQPPLVKRRAG